MSLISELPKLIEESKAEYENAACGQFQVSELYGKEPDENLIVRSDNLSFMKYLIEEKGMGGKIKLIYIDPPFFSRASYDGVIKLRLPDSGRSVNVKLMAYEDA